VLSIARALLLPLVALVVVCPTDDAVGGPALPSATIVTAHDASALEALAAREVRRYVYLRTGRLLPIAPSKTLPADGDLIVIAQTGSPLGLALERNVSSRFWGRPATCEAYVLAAATVGNRTVVLVRGADALGTLYGAYRLAEHLGVRFYLHGDVVPEDRIAPSRLLADLGLIEELRQPLFATRGIQPFHDFPEGPDWWNANDYKAILAQLPKLRMNFFGLHTYPEGGPNAEPTVWIGLPGDIGNGAAVTHSYPSSYQNTLRGNWGYQAKKTSEWSHGTAELFSRDAFGADVMRDLCPQPTDPEACNELFGRVGGLLREAFTFARRLGVKTCVGTETPLRIPAKVQERLKTLGKNPSDPKVAQELYAGIFRRIAQAYPLDYYWFWTPETWTWKGATQQQVDATLADLKAALAAHRQVRPGFTLATCGWVLGPPKNPALFDNHLPKTMPMSCINRKVGKEPVEPGFASVTGRPQWAIPWMEDDPNLLAPQLWVGRMRQDATDAHAYGCTGLLGIHWRTRVLGPNVAALARAAWDQDGWRNLPAPKGRQVRVSGPLGNNRQSHFTSTDFADTDQDPIYQHVRFDFQAYQFAVPDGAYRVTLKFCEPYYNEAGKRAFGVKLEGKRVIKRLDAFAEVGKNRALDKTFDTVAVTDGWLDIEFVYIIEYSCLAGIQIEGPTLKEPIKINCGGPAWKDWRADWTDTVDGGGAPATQRHAPSGDFYLDWCRSQFGPAVAQDAAAIFQARDGHLPEPSTWAHGPGGLKPSPATDAQLDRQYGFVEAFAGLRPKVRGAGCRERFDWWLHQFRFMVAIERVRTAWHRKDTDALRTALTEAYGHLLATVTTTGGLGTVANLEQHILPGLKVDGLPATYNGPTRLIVPTVRTLLEKGEPLDLTVIALSAKRGAKPVLHVRPLGGGAFEDVPCNHVARAVYCVRIQPPEGGDFEYYVQAAADAEEPVRWPPTAPDLCQTVVVMPK